MCVRIVSVLGIANRIYFNGIKIILIGKNILSKDYEEFL